MRAGWGALLVVLATACWATSGTFINLILRDTDLTPWGLALWRDLATCICLLIGISVWRRDLLRVRRTDLVWLAIMGTVGIGLMHVMWNSAVMLNGVAVSVVLQYNAPVFVTIMAFLLWREPITMRKVGAIGLAFAGTLLVVRLDGLAGNKITPLGLLLGLGAGLAYGVLTLLAKKLVGSYSTWTVMFYMFGFGVLVLIPFQAAGNPLAPVGPAALAYLAALVVVTTLGGFALFATGLRQLPVSVASIIATTEVPFAAVLSFFTLGQLLDAWQVVGAVSVVAAVVLLAWPQAGPAPIAVEQPAPIVS
jgi:drug/metabolite transporter, DME family